MKRYEVRGMMEWHPEFRVGRSRLKVAFTGGHLSAGGCTPASFETADPVVQAVIEASEPYKRKLITGTVMEGGHPDRRPAGPVASTVCGTTEVSEPTHGCDARTSAPERAPQAAPLGAAVRMTALHAPATAIVFASLDEAQDYLQRTKGVSIDCMLDARSCIAIAAQLGIELKIKESGEA